MKTRVRKIAVYTFSSLALVIFLLLFYVQTMLPNVGEPYEVRIDVTEERVERGKYMANYVSVCIDCHSGRDWTSFSGPLIPGTEGQGGEVFDQNMGFPGKFVAKNITPYKLKDWTDGEIFRAVTTGVNKEGEALFSIMPHASYGAMDEEDIKDIIAYLRTLKPIEFDPEDSKADFPMNFIINTIPKKAKFTSRPPKTDVINYGKYLVTAASCYDCHTRQVKGKYVGEPFAGGFEFRFPDGSVLQSANITPSESSGIGLWSKERFIGRFKAFAGSSYIPQKLQAGDYQTPMPWTFYGQMTEDDLGAIYEYLKTLKPVDEGVKLYQPAKVVLR